MESELLVNPYISIGDIKFGMKKEEVVQLFEREPDTSFQDCLKRTDARWENISVKFNKKGLVNEVSFVDGKYQVFFEKTNLLSKDIIEVLKKKEKPLDTVGFKVFFEVGVALCGFGRNKEEKSVSIFSKELIKIWKSQDDLSHVGGAKDFKDCTGFEYNTQEAIDEDSKRKRAQGCEKS